MDRARRTIAWSSSSREARTGVLLPTHSARKEANGRGTAHHCVEQTLAGGSHGRTASHPFAEKREWMGHRAPLHGAAARGRLARAYCFPPIPLKNANG